jgi:alkylation response protein AidB-like acyl-CoA dehydrogenase
MALITIQLHTSAADAQEDKGEQGAMALSEEHVQVRDMVRRFADEVIRPVAASLDEEERFPAEVYAQMAELGLFGIGVPEAYGGAGMDALAYALVMEELSRGYASIADQCGLVELIGTLLTVHGTDAQRARYLLPTLRAERRCAYAITEAEAGSDVSGIRTTAEPASCGFTTRPSAISPWCWRGPTRPQASAA